MSAEAPAIVEITTSPVETIPPGSTVVFLSDLDGTYLDHQNYSHEEADSATSEAKNQQKPIVFVTSKTFAEIEVIEKEIDIWQNAPFIVENGGAIYIPKDYFSIESLRELSGSAEVIEDGDWIKVIYGKPYQELRAALSVVAEELNLEVRGIGDMTVSEFAADCGLPIEAAENAKKREFQEGFKILRVPEEKMSDVQNALQSMLESIGYYMSKGGRYFQVMGSPAKIVAVETLLRLFEKKFGKVFSVGLGDAPADYEFMRRCNVGYVIANPHKTTSRDESISSLRFVEEIGPAGWNKVVTAICQGKVL